MFLFTILPRFYIEKHNLPKSILYIIHDYVKHLHVSNAKFKIVYFDIYGTYKIPE